MRVSRRCLKAIVLFRMGIEPRLFGLCECARGRGTVLFFLAMIYACGGRMDFTEALIGRIFGCLLLAGVLLALRARTSSG